MPPAPAVLSARSVQAINTFANWQTATGQDANSISVDPLFMNPNGTPSPVDLHLMPGSPMIAMATPVVGITNDFDGNLAATLAHLILARMKYLVCGRWRR